MHDKFVAALKCFVCLCFCICMELSTAVVVVVPEVESEVVLLPVLHASNECVHSSSSCPKGKEGFLLFVVERTRRTIASCRKGVVGWRMKPQPLCQRVL